MKKTILAIVAILALFGSTATPATANNLVDKIAIIDSYFDPSIAGTHICVADFGCNVTPINKASDAFLHGTKMAAIVKKHNPNAQLVLIRAGSVVGTTISDANAREISNALLAVPADADVVSISIYSNGSGTGNGTGCRPSNKLGYSLPLGNDPIKYTVNVSSELIRATNAVKTIVSSGRAVVAAVGNGRLAFPAPYVQSQAMSYPACISAVTSVAVVGLVGTSNINTEIVLSPNGNYLGGDIATTSGATAFIASKWDKYQPILFPNKINVVGLLQ